MEQLLQQLADGQFHSGEALGQTMGLSRAAIWKKLQSLQTMGLPLESISGKGYRLQPGVELLSQQAITDALSADVRQKVTVQTQVSTTSTNDDVEKMDTEGGQKIVAALAEFQTNGRGRRGRQWQNPMGATISLSLRWQVGASRASFEGLSLAVGVAVANALTKLGVNHLALKWPNDLLWKHGEGFAKLGGILLELHGDPMGECDVIIGVGVNMRLSDEQRSSIDQAVADVTTAAGQIINRNAIAAALIEHIVNMLTVFSTEGFTAYRQAWLNYNAFADQPVVLQSVQGEVHGVLTGVDERGGVILQTQDGEKIYNGGEISLRVVPR